LGRLLLIGSKNKWQAFFINNSDNQSHHPKTFFMSGLLYLIAVILIIGWLLGVFVYSVGGLIHILIVLAIISLILGIIRRA
jgi:predicted lipid-binding transport protein (Tim44 family)